MKIMGIIVWFMLIGLLTGCGGGGSGGGDGGGGGGGGGGGNDTIDPNTITPSSITTFSSVNGDNCSEDGKPVIRMFSTSTCPHCEWTAGAFDPVVEMYVEEGLIVAHHWDLNTGDDLLTPQVETSIPQSEMNAYTDARYGFQNYVPAFVFGCKYYRLGTGFEGTDNLRAEAAEFMAVIEALLDAE